MKQETPSPPQTPRQTRKSGEPVCYDRTPDARRGGDVMCTRVLVGQAYSSKENAEPPPFKGGGRSAILAHPLQMRECYEHAGGARVDIGRRRLFETGRWRGAPPDRDPFRTQVRTARRDDVGR